MKRPLLPTVAVTVLLAALVSACGDDEPSGADDPVSPASGSPSESEPGDTGTTDAATDEPTESGGGSAGTVTVPVYFVGDTPQGPRLFREFRKVEADNPLEEAAALMTAGDTLDPDYRTMYPGGSFDSVSFENGEFVVAVQDDGWNTAGAGSEGQLAVQQLVYTLQGVEQTRAPVRIVFAGSGEPAEVFFGQDASGGFRQAPPTDVLGLVNVTTPEEGSTVADTFTATGVASSFEATVPWEVRDQSGKVVADGFATAEGWGEKLYPWETEVDVSGLEPGTYEFVALTDDPSNGEGGGPHEDSKTITVE